MTDTAKSTSRILDETFMTCLKRGNQFIKHVESCLICKAGEECKECERCKKALDNALADYDSELRKAFG